MIKNDTVPLEWRWPAVLETLNKANKRASTLIRANKKKSSLLSFTSQSVASSGIFSMDILEHGPFYSLSSFCTWHEFIPIVYSEKIKSHQ